MLTPLATEAIPGYLARTVYVHPAIGDARSFALTHEIHAGGAELWICTRGRRWWCTGDTMRGTLTEAAKRIETCADAVEADPRLMHRDADGAREIVQQMRADAKILRECASGEKATQGALFC